jgi:hypothetical protein
LLLFKKLLVSVVTTGITMIIRKEEAEDERKRDIRDGRTHWSGLSLDVLSWAFCVASAWRQRGMDQSPHGIGSLSTFFPGGEPWVFDGRLLEGLRKDQGSV